MLKGGPLLPIDFKTIHFSEEEKKCWKWYREHHLIVSLAILEGGTYGFNRLGEYFLVTYEGIESKWDRGTWIEDSSALHFNKEALKFYV